LSEGSDEEEEPAHDEEATGVTVPAVSAVENPEQPIVQSLPTAGGDQVAAVLVRLAGHLANPKKFSKAAELLSKLFTDVSAVTIMRLLFCLVGATLTYQASHT
jgi:hypothetical protein